MRVFVGRVGPDENECVDCACADLIGNSRISVRARTAERVTLNRKLAGDQSARIPALDTRRRLQAKGQQNPHQQRDLRGRASEI